MDKAFLTATAIPLMGLVGAIAYKFRPVEWQKGDGKKVHHSPEDSSQPSAPFTLLILGGHGEWQHTLNEVKCERGDACLLQVFEDSETGAVFETEESVSPERDRKGELAFRAVSYTPWPVEEGAEGDRVRVPVGPVSNTQPRTYVFPR